MSEFLIMSAVVGFALGWIANEAYEFYKHSKNRRWK